MPPDATPIRDEMEGALVEHADIPGLLAVPLVRHLDGRGSFLKSYNSEMFARLGLDHHWHEAFYSWSNPGVVRGLHFQVPPYSHAKSVLCLAGRILDVVVDLRQGSPTERRCSERVLDASDPMAIQIPHGCAHGFAVLGPSPALVAYLVSSVHHPAADSGILWSSVPASWPSRTPILSDRDASFPALSNFTSPFHLPSC